MTDQQTKTALLERARELDIAGRTTMEPDELETAIHRAEALAATQAAAAEAAAQRDAGEPSPAAALVAAELDAKPLTQEQADELAAQTHDDDDRAKVREASEARAAERAANMLVIGTPNPTSEEG